MKDFIRYTEGENLYPDPISDSEALDILKTFFLGDDWYVVDPLAHGQVNVLMVEAILKSFPRKYKKFIKSMGWKRPGVK